MFQYNFFNLYNLSVNVVTSSMFFATLFLVLIDLKIFGDWTYDESLSKWNPPERTLFMRGASQIEFYYYGIFNPYNIPRTKLPNNEIIFNEQY